MRRKLFFSFLYYINLKAGERNKRACMSDKAKKERVAKIQRSIQHVLRKTMKSVQNNETEDKGPPNIFQPANHAGKTHCGLLKQVAHTASALHSARALHTGKY